ncbi:MAG: ATP-binding cassette domain-containing protein [Leifsonia sp.]
MPEPILSLRNVSVQYPSRSGARIPVRRSRAFTAVDDVSFDISSGETVALVGESGSGKSSVGNAVLGLAPVHSGTVHFEGRDITRLRGRDRRNLADRLQVVFQNPYGSLNPSLRIGQILTEPLRTSGMSKERSDEVIEGLLAAVGLPSDARDRYPEAFSGGQRQRIAVARALARRPRLIVCDEPTSALDVSTQSTVLEMLKALQVETQVAYLFITHDLAVVRHFADRVLVLRKGNVVEQGSSKDVCEHPAEEYTKALVAAAPVPDPIIQAARREQRRGLLSAIHAVQ